MGFLNILGTVAGGIGGFLIGGPAGAAAGASLGGSITGAIEGESTARKAIREATQAQVQGFQQGREDILGFIPQQQEFLAQGLEGALGALQGVPGISRAGVGSAFGRARQDVAQGFGLAREAQTPFAAGDVSQSFELQQALSGALGPEAQALAFANFQESPGVQFLREQGLAGINRNTAALGGVGGGERLKALSAFNQGLALQDFNNQFARLGQITGVQQGAANVLSNLGAQQAGIGAQLGTSQAGINANLNIAQGGQNTALAQAIANAFGGTATQQAGVLSGVGTNLANLATGIGGAQGAGAIGQGQATLGGIQGITEGLGAFFGSQAGQELLGGLFGSSGTTAPAGVGLVI